jgi:hypothetical protein
MRTTISNVLAAALFLGGVASAQRFRFVVSEYLGTPGEINTWEAWYATVEGTTGGLWIGDEIPVELTGVTDIRSETRPRGYSTTAMKLTTVTIAKDWNTYTPEVIVEPEPAIENFPGFSYLYFNRQADGPVLFDNDMSHHDEEINHVSFVRYGTHVLPAGYLASQFYIEESATAGTFSVNWFADDADVSAYRRVNLTAIL